MDPADFSVWKWLAELLGPGGFVAFVAAGVEAWFIYKLMGWHRKERIEFHATCKIERDEWATRLDKMDVEKTLKFNQQRKDTKEHYRAIGAVTDGLKEASGYLARLAKIRSAPVRRGR